MEALPSSIPATAASPQLASRATGRAGSGATALPAFAQVVHEVLNRPAAAPAAQQPASPSKTSASPNVSVKPKALRQSEKDTPQIKVIPSGLVAAPITLLPPPLSALQMEDQIQQSPSAASTLGNVGQVSGGDELGAPGALPSNNTAPAQSAALNGNSASNENSVSPVSTTTTGAILAERIQSQLSIALPAQLPSSAAQDFSAASPSSGTPPSSYGTTPPNPKTASDTIAKPANELPSNAPAISEPQLAPAADDSLSSPLLPSAPSPAPHTQHGHVDAPPTTAHLKEVPAQVESQAQPHAQPQSETQQVRQSILMPLPVLGAQPAVATFSIATPKGLQSAIDEAQAPQPVQVPPVSSSSHEGAQDPSANHKEPDRPDTNSTADAPIPVSAAHDATPIPSALPIRLDDTQSPPAAASVLPNPPVAPSETAGGAVATPHQNAPAAPPPPPLLEDANSVANHIVNNAKLVEAAGHSEMRIAMDTDKLGPVELRAHMVGDEVGAAITVEKRDAHAALAIELPALQQALSDKQLRIEQVTLLHGALNSTAGDASASPKQDQRSTPHAPLAPWSAGTEGTPSMFAGSEQSEIFDSQGRLSVLA
jgi:hypothetical protein